MSETIIIEKKYIVTAIFYSFGLLISSNLTSHMSFSVQASKIYGGSEGEAQLLGSSAFLGNILFNFPANFAVEKLGLRISVLLAACILLLGNLLKMLVSWDYKFFLVGMLLIMIPETMLFNLIPRFANTWYSSESSSQVTNYLLSYPLFGFAGGYLINSLLFGSTLEEYANSAGHLQNQTFPFINRVVKMNLLIFLVLSIGIIVFIYLYVDERPKICPNNTSNIKRISFMSSFKHMIKNKNFLKICAANSFLEANFFLLSFLLYYMMANYYVGEHVIFNTGLLMNTAAGVFYLFLGVYSKYEKSPKKLMKKLIIGNIIAFPIFFMVLGVNSPMIIYAAAILYGLFFDSFSGPAIELASESVFPVSEEQATGFLMVTSGICSMILSYMISTFYFRFPSLTVFPFIVLLLLYFLAYVLTINIKEDLKKKKLDCTLESKLQLLQRDIYI